MSSSSSSKNSWFSEIHPNFQTALITVGIVGLAAVVKFGYCASKTFYRSWFNQKSNQIKTTESTLTTSEQISTQEENSVSAIVTIEAQPDIQL